MKPWSCSNSRASLAALAAALFLFSSPAWAGAQGGAWVVAPGSDSSGDSRQCLMKNSFDNGHSLAIARSVSGEASAAVDFGKDTFSPGQPYAVRLEIAPVSRLLAASAASPQVLLLDLGEDPDFFERIAAGSQLRLTVEKKDYDYSLKGTRDAVDALAECAATLSGGGQPQAEMSSSRRAALQPIIRVRQPGAYASGSGESADENDEPELEAMAKEHVPGSAPPPPAVPVPAVAAEKLAGAGEPEKEEPKAEVKTEAAPEPKAVAKAEPKAAPETMIRLARLEEENRDLRRSLSSAEARAIERARVPAPAAPDKAAQEELRQLRADNANLKDRLDRLETIKPSKYTISDADRKELESLRAQNMALKDKAVAALEATKTAEADLAPRLKKLEEENASLKKVLAAPAKPDGALKKETEQLRADNAALKDKIAALSAAPKSAPKGEALKKEADQLRADNAALQDKIAALAASPKSTPKDEALKKEMEQLRADNAALKEKVATLAASGSAQGKAAAGRKLAEEENAKLKADLAAAKSRAADTARQSGADAADLKEKITALAGARAAQTDLSARLKEAEDEGAALRKRLAEPSAAELAMTKEADQLRTDNAALREKAAALAALTVEHAALAARQKQAEADITKLKGELAVEDVAARKTEADMAALREKAARLQVENDVRTDLAARQKILDGTNEELRKSLATARARAEDLARQMSADNADLKGKVSAARETQADIAARQKRLEEENAQMKLDLAAQKARAEADAATLQEKASELAAAGAAQDTLSARQKKVEEENAELKKSLADARQPHAARPALAAASPAPSAPAAALKPATAAAAAPGRLGRILERSRVVPPDGLTPHENGASRLYRWQSGGIAGAAEERAKVAPKDFDAMVRAYFDRRSDQCPGDFAHAKGKRRAEGGVILQTAEMACIGRGSNVASALVFIADGSGFSVVAHEAGARFAQDAIIRRNAVAAAAGVR